MVLLVIFVYFYFWIWHSKGLSWWLHTKQFCIVYRFLLSNIDIYTKIHQFIINILPENLRKTGISFCLLFVHKTCFQALNVLWIYSFLKYFKYWLISIKIFIAAFLVSMVFSLGFCRDIQLHTPAIYICFKIQSFQRFLIFFYQNNKEKL